MEIEREQEALGLEIDAHPAITAWQGEVMDYGMGVECSPVGKQNITIMPVALCKRRHA